MVLLLTNVMFSFQSVGGGSEFQLVPLLSSFALEAGSEPKGWLVATPPFACDETLILSAADAKGIINKLSL